MKQLIKLLFIAATTLFLTGATIYKWVDENGKKHFSTRPPPVNTIDKANVSSGKYGTVKKTEISEVFQNIWFAKDRQQLIKFLPTSSSYSWSTYSLENYEAKRGQWKLTHRDLQLTDSQKNPTRYYIKKVSQYNLVLVEVGSNKVYNFIRQKEILHNLSEKEQQAEGRWNEYNPNALNTIIAKIEFSGNTFTRHAAGRIQQRKQDHTPTTRNLVAAGNWRIEGNQMILEYTEAYKTLLDKATTTEKWDIRQLDYRNLHLVSETGQHMIFKRKRTK